MTLPAPLVAAGVDLRDFRYMELDVQLLRDSKFAAEVKPEAFRAGVLLWCASWHQVPAGSLPDSDVELAKLAGYGYVVKEWKKVRAQALSLFTLCSDGRLYHRVIAEKATAAWESKLHHQHDRLCDRLRKANGQRQKQSLEPLPLPTFDEWNSARLAAEIQPAPPTIPAEQPPPSAGIPPENALRGNRTERNGEGTETSSSEAIASGGEPPTDRDLVFALGVPLLTAAGVVERNARSMLAAQSKTHGERAVVGALRRCAIERPVQPVSWLQAALKTGPVDREARVKAENAASAAGAKLLLGIPETHDA